MTRRMIKVALILCDEPAAQVKAEYGDYGRIFETWLSGSLATHPDEAVAHQVDLRLDAFDLVGNGQLPAVDDLRAGVYDVVMLTGSKHTAFEATPEWIPGLITYIRDIAADPALSRLKIVGICFGHQIIALAMGAQCTRGTNGWEVGVYGCDVTDEGKKIFVSTGMGKADYGRVQMHRDQVPTPPEGFHVCLTTPKYPIQAMIKYRGASPSVPHIFSVQGHPEFVPGLVGTMIDIRDSQGIFDGRVAAEARRRAGGKDGTGGEGLGRVGWAIWNVMLA